MNAIIETATFDIRAIDRSALVDIRDVMVNMALPKRERVMDFIRQIGNPYCYRRYGKIHHTALHPQDHL